MDAVTVTKFVAGMLVGIGVSEIVKSIVNNNVTPEDTADKVFVTAGRWGLSAFVADMTVNHTETIIDNGAKFLSRIFSK
jgi:hypothetical protein